MKEIKKRFIKLLLVEDSKEDVTFFKRLVKSANEQSDLLELETTSTNSLSLGIEKAKRETPDLILLDLYLPDSSGLGALIDFKKDFGDEVPYIILTGDKREQQAIMAMRNGAQDYLIKGETNAYALSRSILYALERFETAQEIENMRVKQAQYVKMATLGEIAGDMAHEINNPLTIIAAYSEKIAKQALSSELEHIHRYGKKVVKLTERMARIVKSLRNYSRRDDLDPMTPVNIQDIISDTLELCSQKFKSAGITLNIDNTSKAMVFCRDVQISQVLMNLLSNAHDAIKSNDEKWIKIWNQIDDENLYLYVADSGALIDKKVIKKMFTPYFTTKGKNKGTGLGMGISKTIMRAHNGELEFMEDAINTTFRITLPLYLLEKSAA